MLGFGSLETALAFWFTLGAAALCVIWGIAKWNKGKDED